MTDHEPTPDDLDVLEETDTAYNPAKQYIDLNKEEKRRTTALMMAVNAYRELIIKEADYLEKAADLARRGEGPTLKPATIDAMVEAAFKFDCFIAGEAQPTAEETEELRGGFQTGEDVETADETSA